MSDRTGASTNSPNGLASSLAMLATLIHERTGLSFESNRLDVLADKLTPLLTEGHFDNFLDLYYFLKYDEHSVNAWLRLQATLAVNETYFWREYDQVNAITQTIVPRLQHDRPGIPVRIWHAACATGEEPYTMAIALQESGAFARGPVELLATDFNMHALSQARLGLYRQRSFRNIPPEILAKYFIPQEQDQHRLADTVRARVNFSYLNLLDESGMASMRDIDIILCRNVFIYFSDASIRRVTDWFYRSLIDSGFLFVAAAESLLRLSSLFELVEVAGAFGYKKRTASGLGAGRSSASFPPSVIKSNLDDSSAAQVNPRSPPGDL